MITRSIDHQYTYEGKTYPGVTGILKVLDKSEVLKQWAAKETAKLAVKSIEILPKMLADGGEQGVVKFLADRSNWTLEDARQLGTDVHAVAERVNRGEDSGEMTPTVALYVEHYRTWLAASGWNVKISEALLVSPKGGYGGTLDILARDRDGRSVLADIKTGKGVYKETILQLAAYGMSELIEPAGQANVFPMPAVERYVVIHVTATGVREIEIPVTDRDRQAFYAALDLSEWTKTQKGRAL